jgi:hypothetical protein
MFHGENLAKNDDFINRGGKTLVSCTKRGAKPAGGNFFASGPLDPGRQKFPPAGFAAACMNHVFFLDLVY